MRRGMTLLEVIIALGILALVIGLGIQLGTVVLVNTQRTRQSQLLFEQAYIAGAMLQTHLREAVAITGQTTGDGQLISLTLTLGEVDGLSTMNQTRSFTFGPATPPHDRLMLGGQEVARYVEKIIVTHDPSLNILYIKIQTQGITSHYAVTVSPVILSLAIDVRHKNTHLN